MGDVNTNYKRSTIIGILTLLVALTGGTAGLLYNLKTTGSLNARVSTVAEVSAPKVQATTTLRYVAEKGKTVLEQLRHRERVVTQQDTQDSSFVESINGLKNGADNKYWAYYINGHITGVEADKYVTKGGEEIVWKFE